MTMAISAYGALTAPAASIAWTRTWNVPRGGASTRTLVAAIGIVAASLAPRDVPASSTYDRASAAASHAMINAVSLGVI